MCCFTKPVRSVESTRIFARADANERQFLAYSMKVDAEEDLAMVLPLPVTPGTGEDGVQFISLKNYPIFFDDMEIGFPQPPQERARSFGIPSASLRLQSQLPVVQVGDFEASFVPTEKDFSRLDARFRLPKDAWKKLPRYHDYGFAVFKLKPRGRQQVHPMAFSFPRRDVHSLFFPTVHIHDGKVHSEAEFDHILYCQPNEGEPLKFGSTYDWQESSGHALGFVKIAQAQKLVVPDQHCYRRPMTGMLPNRDTFVALES